MGIRLREARGVRVNGAVEEELLSQPIFDPASLDAPPPNALPPPPFLLVDDVLELDDGGVNCFGWPCAPWEVKP